MWLKQAAGAAVASVAAGALVRSETDPASADHASSSVEATTVTAHHVDARWSYSLLPTIIAVHDNLNHAIKGTTTSATHSAILGQNNGTGSGVLGSNTSSGPGVRGQSTNNTGAGVHGKGAIGVVGESSTTGNGAVYGNHTGTGGYGVVGDANGVFPSSAVLGRNGGTGVGVTGRCAGGTGVYGDGAVGVTGESSTTGNGATYGNHKGAGYGVVGDTTTGDETSGVLGRHRGSYGAGVRGESVTNTGPGVLGIGNFGVSGRSANAAGCGVSGLATNGGNGVIGDTESGVNPGVLGRNYGTGPAVSGLNTQRNGDGVRGEGKVGVHGKSGTTGGNAVWGEGAASATGVAGTSTSGYGGYFRGGKAQLRLALSSTAGKPTAGAHVKGEIYMDSAATLYVCTVAGTPGTWRRLTTTTA